MSDKVVKIKCPKCGGDLRIHQPVIVRLDNGVMSQVTLVPGWSADERMCKGCGSMVSPVFTAELPIMWAAMEASQEPEEKKIIQPNMVLPVDFKRKMKMY